MKALTLLAATLLLGLTSYAQDNQSFKQESIRVVDQALAANQLTYSLVGHPRDGEPQSEPSKPIRLSHSTGDIAVEFVNLMRRSLSGSITDNGNQVSFSCNEQSSQCDLSIVTPVSSEDRQAGYMDHAVLRFSLEVENGRPVRVKDNHLALHLYAAGVN